MATIVVYIDLIPLPSSSLGFLPNHAYQNTPRFNTYDQPEAGGFGYETPPQFPFRAQLIDMTPARATTEPGTDPDNLINQLATILCESFSVDPKGRGHVNQKPYPDYYDQLPYPKGYRVPEFSKFSWEGGTSTLEHVGQFISAKSGSLVSAVSARSFRFVSDSCGNTPGYLASSQAIPRHRHPRSCRRTSMARKLKI
jgi:hypothetical protein